ncbi:MAG: NADH:flavin oxidoreductase [Acidobacteriaceae bacterium]|jgi:N-ethylmaleimide reductase|nr:NADH:flavin oxidoreductase [Acidobacteriaceae bacterium]
MSQSTLFTPLRVGALELPNRIVMAPLTRMRASSDGSPTKLTVEYYKQRASAGLIITEGTAISVQGQGYPNAPGIYTAEQIAAWREVTDAVHTNGGRIVMQLAHNGRNSHSSLHADGSLPVSSSAIPPNGPVLTSSFQQVPAEIPRALERAEVSRIIHSYRDAALNAVAAGFDGVELQGANSHLIEQFLETGTNQRTDSYGGPIQNRARFLLEIVDEVTNAIGADRLGVRLSPFGQYGGISDAAPFELFKYVIVELSSRKIAYLHLIEARGSEMGLTDELHADAVNNVGLFRSSFDGPFISAAAYTPESAAIAVESGAVDAIAFGRLFIANPDLPTRISLRAPLNKYNRATFYGGGADGYIDYPTLAGLE